MTIQIINPAAFPDWNRQVSTLPGATIFHSANWARVLSKSYRYTPHYFCAFNNDELKGVIPAMEISSMITGKRGVGLPFSDQVEPLVKDQEMFDDLLESMVSFGEKNKWKTLTFHGGRQLLRHQPAFTSYISSMIQMDETPDTLLKSFKSNTRRNIKKARKSGLTTEILKSKEATRTFYELNGLSRKEHGLPPQPYSFFERIYEHIFAKDLGFICIARYEGVPVAGVVFLIFNQKAIYKYGASDRRYLKFRPNNLSMWDAIQWCAENNMETIDLGRSDVDHHGLLRFKRSWNSVETDLNYYKFDFGQRMFLENVPKIKSSYGFFKKMPLSLLKLMGKLLYRHVG